MQVERLFLGLAIVGATLGAATVLLSSLRLAGFGVGEGEHDPPIKTLGLRLVVAESLAVFLGSVVGIALIVRGGWI
jgi:hypothetical protein